MSALGQKQTSRPEVATSALPPKADIAGRQFDVRFVPKAELAIILDAAFHVTSFMAHGRSL
jgi:hypothetical protein